MYQWFTADPLARILMIVVLVSVGIIAGAAVVCFGEALDGDPLWRAPEKREDQ